MARKILSKSFFPYIVSIKNMTIKKIFSALLAFFITFSAQSLYGINIIFDLGGVLINTTPSFFIKKIDKKSLITYILCFNNPLNVKKSLFKLLSAIPVEGAEIGAEDGNGSKLPAIMCQWLLGEKTSTDIKNLAVKFLDENPNFCKFGEKPLLLNLIELTFSKETLGKSSIILKEGFEFVKKCKESGHKLFILSNWDIESSFLIPQEHPELFDLFEKENIVFSGQIGLIKPDERIYKYILQKYNLNPNDCIFFDDQEINIAAAKKLSIHGVLVKNLTCNQMIRELNLFIRENAKTAFL